jgi:hypothetical protein
MDVRAVLVVYPSSIFLTHNNLCFQKELYFDGCQRCC